MNTRNPILFLVFNRPDTTERVFQAIRAARPPRLYVAADGPRPDKPDEAERCEAVRRIATAVDWPCELVTLLRPDNLGCKLAVSSAITWFFESEVEGIVLEDDCLPDASFFPYVDELLERYRDDTRVMCVSGDNFISPHWAPAASFYFTRFPHIWGWATWRRAWQHYDVNMKDWHAIDKGAFLKRQFPTLARARPHWQRIFDDVSTGRIDTWDYQWTYACWKHDALSCMPRINLISNIGFGPGATHTISAESKLSNLAASAISLPLQYPQSVQVEEYADRWTSKHVFDIDEGRLPLRRWSRAISRRVARIWAHSPAKT